MSLTENNHCFHSIHSIMIEHLPLSTYVLHRLQFITFDLALFVPIRYLNSPCLALVDENCWQCYFV